MDLDEMLHVDRRRDMDELINFWARSRLVRMPEPDCFLLYRLSAATPNFTSGKSDVYVLAAAARRGFNMVSLSQWAVETPLSEVHALHRVRF